MGAFAMTLPVDKHHAEHPPVSGTRASDCARGQAQDKLRSHALSVAESCARPREGDADLVRQVARERAALQASSLLALVDAAEVTEAQYEARDKEQRERKALAERRRKEKEETASRDGEEPVDPAAA